MADASAVPNCASDTVQADKPQQFVQPPFGTSCMIKGPRSMTGRLTAICNACNKCCCIMQALQASVTIVDVEVVSIDRTQQLITLSNSQKVLYGMLVITAGLVQTMPSEDIMLQLQISGSNVVSLKDADSMPTQVAQVALRTLCIRSMTY